MKFISSLIFVSLFLVEVNLVQGQQVDIVQTAINNGNFKTLVTALQAATLVETLKGPGPFTVFAPTDAAFAKLPAGTVDDLLKPENKEKLVNILKYHVIGKRVTAADITGMTLPAQVETLATLRVIVDTSGTAVKVNSATVTIADVMATNGIIHAIDTVLLPPTDIAQTAIDNGNFKTLVAALQAADLVNTLKGAGPFTVFAPTDAAFAKLPAGTVDDLLKPENKEKLSNILKYHVVGKLVTAAAIGRMTLPANVAMLAGGSVRVSKDGNNVKINDATVTTADVFNTNGVIHIIDTVLMPQASSATSFYLSQGLFTILISAIFFSYRLFL